MLQGNRPQLIRRDTPPQLRLRAGMPADPGQKFPVVVFPALLAGIFSLDTNLCAHRRPLQVLVAGYAVIGCILLVLAVKVLLKLPFMESELLVILPLQCLVEPVRALGQGKSAGD